MSAVQQSLVTAFPNPGLTAQGEGSGGPPAPVWTPRSTDSIEPPAFAAGSAAGGSGFSWGAGTDSDGGLAGFNNIMNGFINALQNALSSLASQFGLSSGSSPNPSPGQAFFSNATASSVGDPHESFNGSCGGNTVGGKWDNMAAHDDLLDSDSFGGGYRVATSVTTPGATGVTQNASASVFLGGGSSAVTMNADGSYSVQSGGQNVALQHGQSLSLGNGESVTLGAGNSLSVEADTAGGSLTTTLSANGTGGVDVSDTAKNVDLGGYLVTHADTPHYPLPGTLSPPPAGQNESYTPGAFPAASLLKASKIEPA